MKLESIQQCSAPVKLESIQQLFDEMVGHVIEQGRPGATLEADDYGELSEVLCRYKAEDGAACAVGHILVKYGVYGYTLEGWAVGNEFVDAALVKAGLTPEMLKLAASLQTCHDNAAQASVGYDGFNNEAFMRDFVSQVTAIGVNYDLSLDVLGSA